MHDYQLILNCCRQVVFRWQRFELCSGGDFGMRFCVFVICFVVLLLSLHTQAFAQQDVAVADFAPATMDSGSDDTSDFRVFAIGVSRYQELQLLDFTASDARQIIKAYAEVGGVDQTRRTLVVDDRDDSDLLDAKTVTEQISRFLEDCEADDTAVLFFSGHGVQLKSGFALAAGDFSAERSDIGSVSIDWLRTALSTCAARRKIVILDCCFSGAFGAASTDLTTPFRSIPGCVVMAASRPSEVSLETEQLKAGVFTHWLVRGLRGAANVKIDGVIDATELFAYVSQGVGSTTAKQQSPAIAFDQSTEIPALIDLNHPDRPSDNVGVIPFPLPPSPRTMSIVLDSIGRFPEAKPRRTIGVCHWVIQHADVRSSSAKRARELVSQLDARILAGKVSLGQVEEDEEPIRRRVPTGSSGANDEL